MLPLTTRFRLAWYGTTIFLSSAILLVLEITAGRLIAPYVGVTIYSWTSIIGVILAGLSLGNWLGGRWADRGADERSTGIALALAAAFSLLSLLTLTLIAPMLQSTSIDLISASFLYVLCLFFVPALLLGIPTPLLTTLALNLDERTGHIVGRMHALAALGSILGTFVTGFFLIQYFGSRVVVVIASLILLLLAIPFLLNASRRQLAGLVILGAITIALVHTRQGITSPCSSESSYFCLRVVDASERAPFGRARALVLDHLLHGINHESEPEMLISPYVHLMQELVERHFAGQDLPRLHYFFAGGGSYTQPRAVKETYPDATITVAELDPMVTRTVQESLFLDPAGMNIHHGDARAVLFRQADASFDVVVTDAFHDIAIPYHLVTLEYARLASSKLKPGGLLTTNVVDVFPDPRMVKSLVNTLRQEFDHVDVWLDHIPQQPRRMTYVISASNSGIDSNVIVATSGFRRQWLRINEPLANSGTALAELPVFTDDFVPVERMISSLLLSAEGL
jgi:spermidine synthase